MNTFICILFIIYGIINLVFAVTAKFVTAKKIPSDKYIDKDKFTNSMCILFIIIGFINIILGSVSLLNDINFSSIFSIIIVIYLISFLAITKKYGTKR